MENKVFKTVDNLKDHYLEVWEDVCNIDSPSSYKEGVDKVGQYFIDIAKSRGWEAEVFEFEKFGNVVCITMNGDVEAEPLVLSGHMDTVHPVGLFGTPAVKIEGDKIYGPGVMDCKGGIVAGFLAMDALHACGFKKRPVKIMLQSNEEIGSGINNRGPINLICEKSKDAAAFLNLEPHEGYFDGKVCLIRKGRGEFLFEIRGIEAHASYCAKEGASTIKEAAYKIIEIEKMKDHDGITCNCGFISGGSTANTVPGKCEFKVDVRYSTQEEYEEVKAYLQKIADTVYVPGCSCTITETNSRPSMALNEKNQTLLNKANQAFAANGLSVLEAGKRNGGSDAANVALWGIPCLDAIGIRGERAHSREEYAYIPSLAESAKRVVAIALEI